MATPTCEPTVSYCYGLVAGLYCLSSVPSLRTDKLGVGPSLSRDYFTKPFSRFSVWPSGFISFTLAPSGARLVWVEIYTLFCCWNLGGLLFCCLQCTCSTMNWGAEPRRASDSPCHCPFMVPVVVDIVLGHLWGFYPSLHMFSLTVFKSGHTTDYGLLIPFNNQAPTFNQFEHF